MTIGRRRLVRDVTEPVDDADVPVIDLLYISVRLPGQSAAASVLVFGFSSFPLFLAASTPRMAALVAALVARSTCPGPFHPRPGSIFLGRCGNKRWATSSSPRTAWRRLGNQIPSCGDDTSEAVSSRGGADVDGRRYGTTRRDRAGHSVVARSTLAFSQR